MMRGGLAPGLRQLLALASLPLFVYLAYAVAGRALELYGLRLEMGQVRSDIATLRSQQETLQQQKAFLETDQYVEWVAREELGMVKKGEVGLLILTPDELRTEARPSPSSGAGTKAPDGRPPWLRWWDHFFGPAAP